MSGNRRENDESAEESLLQRRARSIKSVGYYTAIPTMMVAGPVLGYVFGSWLERRIGYAPWVTFAGVVLGGVASIRQVVLLLRRGNG